MAYHYLIDGYNLLYALSEMPAGSWQEKRQALVALLKKKRPQGKNPITLVFDSREGPGNRYQDEDMTVVYTAGETADDWIGKTVRLAANPRILVVVSNDLGIRTLVQGTGARFLTADRFLKVLSHPEKHPPRRDNPPNEITEEL